MPGRYEEDSIRWHAKLLAIRRQGLALIGKAKGRRWRTSASSTRSTTALSPVYLGDYVTLDTGTGIVHSAPAYGVEDFESCRRYGMKDDEILTPVHGRRQVRRHRCRCSAA